MRWQSTDEDLSGCRHGHRVGALGRLVRPPASTHGTFPPSPEEFQQPFAVPACGTEITDNSTEYVSGLRNLLDQAAADRQTGAS